MHPVDEQNEGPGRAIKVAEELPTMLEVEILSSKSKASATVDGATVSTSVLFLVESPFADWDTSGKGANVIWI